MLSVRIGSLFLILFMVSNVPLLSQNQFQNPGFENRTVAPFLQDAANGNLFVESNAAHVFAGTRSLRHEATGDDSFTLPWFGTNVIQTGGNATTYELKVRAKASQSNTQIQLFIFSLDAQGNTSAGNWSLKTQSIGTNWVEITHQYTTPAGRPQASIRLDNDGGNGVTVWWDEIEFGEVGMGEFPAPPAPFTHTAVQNGDWDVTATWLNGQIPGSNAVIRIPQAIDVRIKSLLTPEHRFIQLDGKLRHWIGGNTKLKVETLVVSPSGFYQIGLVQHPVNQGKTAELIITNTGTPIDTQWDPKERSRGVFMQGQFRVFGQPRTNWAELAGEAHKMDTSLAFASVPSDWQIDDELVIAGTQFVRGGQHQDEVVKIQSINGNLVNLYTPVQKDHLQADPSMKIHVANLTRNIIIKSQNASPNHLRGHMMFRSEQVDIYHAAIVDLGRTNKKIPLDDVIVNFTYGTDLDDLGNPIPIAYTVAPNPNPQNRRGRYPIHFHLLGAHPNPAEVPMVHGSVVHGTPGWGFVNHGSHVDFSNNVAYDFDGAGFVTEFGNELGSFTHNIAIRGNGVPGEYFDIRQVFENPTRPQALSDFGFAGDGFWFQGPVLEVIDNVASSCNGAGMIWFGAGAVDIGNDNYVGFPPQYIAQEYANFPDLPNHQHRTWTYPGAANAAVIADLPIKEMNTFKAYGCLVGFHLRFLNHDSVAFYKENAFDYDTRMINGHYLMRQSISDLDLWNNEIGFRVRYAAKTDWSDIKVVNRLRFDKTENIYPGAELWQEANDQVFDGISFDGYPLANWFRSGANDNAAEVTVLNQNYLNYINADTQIFSLGCERIQGVSTSATSANSATLSWNLPSSQNTFLRFLVRYRPIGSIQWQYHNLAVSNATSTTLQNLTPATTYEYQAVAGCDGFHTSWFPTQTFSTQ